MKPLLRSTAAIAALILATGGAQAEGKLSIYHWFEYIPQELLDKFAAEHDVEVVMDTYDSNEAMLATLKAGALGSYDVVVPTDYMVSILIAEGMASEIPEGARKNMANIKAEFKDPAYDPGLRHSIPYQGGTTSFSVDTAAYSGDINTTDIIFNPPAELQGKINMIDSQGEVLALAAVHMGIPQCSTDREQLKALDAMLQAAKPHWASFNSDTAKEVLEAGDVAAGMIFNGFGAKAREARATLQYAFPKQGWVNWMDSVVLLKDAPNPENAILFMDFLLEPENIAAVTNYARYRDAIEGSEAFHDPTLALEPEGNPPAGIEGVFVETCTQEVQAVYDRIWTNLKK
ncbi:MULTISPECIES: extracellular solute-binding protein [Roseobacter]|uniref:extracellular solute-binding protein n=1 Tax=Roseobacter TaxID=2433 RepID=UPI001BC4C56B|nr:MULTISPECIES: extracellular solute-binding protein [Roseobacter]GIT88585.1 putrescine-binding periplasmic protein [Roseobacter sp. OBYS 0001]